MTLENLVKGISGTAPPASLCEYLSNVIIVGDVLISEMDDYLESELSDTDQLKATLSSDLVAELGEQNLTTELNETLEAEL